MTLLRRPFSPDSLGSSSRPSKTKVARIAVVGWSADCGVGRELSDAVANLPVSSAFLLTHSTKRNRFDLVQESIRYVSGGRDPRGEMVSFIDRYKPEVVLTWETPGRWEFPGIWASKGIRWVNVIHWDWFPADQIETLKTASLIAPNELCRDELLKLGMASTVLPVPIDLKQFPFTLRKRADLFGMVYGAGGPHGRRGLVEVLKALEGMDVPPSFSVKAQMKCPEYRLVRKSRLVLGNPMSPASLYEDLDIAVQPSKFEGVGLSLLEAQAVGVPVITVNAEPMRTLSPDLLVDASRYEVSTMSGNKVEAWAPSVESLKKVISGIHGKDIEDLSRRARERAKRYSWERLKDSWEAFLT